MKLCQNWALFSYMCIAILPVQKIICKVAQTSRLAEFKVFVLSIVHSIWQGQDCWLYSNQILNAASHPAVPPPSNHAHPGSSLAVSSSTGTSSSNHISHSLQGSAMSLSSSLSLSSSPSPVSSPHIHGAPTHPSNHPSHMSTSTSSTLSTSNFAETHINKNASKYSGKT